MKTVKDYSETVKWVAKQKREVGVYYPTWLFDLFETEDYLRSVQEAEINKALGIFYEEADLLEEYAGYVFIHNPISLSSACHFERVFLDSILVSKEEFIRTWPFYKNVVNYCVAFDLFEWDTDCARDQVRDKCLNVMRDVYFDPYEEGLSESYSQQLWFIRSGVYFDSITRIKEDLFRVVIVFKANRDAQHYFQVSDDTIRFFNEKANLNSSLYIIQKTLEANFGIKVSLNYFYDDGDTSFYEKYDPTSKSLVYNATPAYEWKGLSFRSEQEVRVAKALDAIGVTFGPNTGLRVTEPDRRHTREVDFLVILDGNIGVLEVDSKQYHDPEKDAIRDAIFKEQGLQFIKRYSYQECLDAQKVAIDFVVSMRSFYGVN